jgi:N-acetylglucosaminyldiphosphoundecaprenol N-acetyl-beta-D-mannosaminyltransferase
VFIVIFASKFSMAINDSPIKPAAPRPWSQRLAPPIVMMGVPLDQVTTPQVLEIIDEMIASRQPHLLATANVDFLAQVQEDESLRSILLATDLVVCDGMPLVWMSRLLGDPLPERVAGSDLVPLLLDASVKKGYRVYFLGGRDEVLLQARTRIMERWSGLEIAGMYSPPFAPLDEMDHEDICRRIREAQADILLVSFGCPKQEKWLARNYREAGVPVAMGVGATIDFLAGAVKRAPMWMRRCGMEWLYRAAQEPKRLVGRYWKDIRIVGPGLLRQLFKMRGRHAAGVAAAEVRATGQESAPRVVFRPLVLKLPVRLDAISARDASLWAQVESDEAAWIVADASEVMFLDSTGTGKLVRLARMARERGGRIILAGATAAVTGPLALMKLNEYFETAPDVPTALVCIPQV